MIKVEDLQTFIINESLNLEKIQNSIDEKTFVEILGVSHRELQHSNFIAWMLDPNAKHQIGEYFLKCFINQLNIPSDRKIVYNLGNLYTTSIFREKYEIDILIHNEDMCFNICIENKIRSGLAEHQLSKYYEIVESRWGNGKYDNYYVYLTPFTRRVPEEWEDVYQNITYDTIYNLIIDSKENFNISPDYLPLINSYLMDINKNILSKNKEAELAQKIYKKYKKVIDFIVQNKPTLATIFQKVNEYFQKSSKYTNLTPDDGLVRILPNEVKDKFDLKSGSWKGTDTMFAIEIFCEQEEISAKFCFGGINTQEQEKKIRLQEVKDRYFEQMKSFSSLSKYKLTRSKSSSQYPYVANYTLLTITKDDDFISQENNIFSAFLKRFEEFEKNVIDEWIKEVNEKIV